MAPNKLKQVADELVLSTSSGLALATQDFLNAVGLEGAHYNEKAVDPGDGFSYAELGDGIWDERTGGGRAIRTRIGLDGKNRLRKMEVLYACVHPLPSNTHETVRLVAFDTRVKGRKLAIKSLCILERPVMLIDEDGQARVMGALKTIHAMLRNLAFPEVAKIFYDFRIPDLLGQTPVLGERREPLNIPGSSYKGHANFLSATNTNPPLQKMILPKDFIRELLGLGTNTIDDHYRLRAANAQVGVHPQNGGLFKVASKLTVLKSGGALVADAKPLSSLGHAIPDLLNLSWSIANDNKASGASAPGATLDKFILLGDDSLGTPHWQHRLGAVNLMNKDMRAGRYPAMPDHLARHQQQSLVDQRAFSSTLDRHVQMMTVPFSGHNDREYLPGFGGTIGGNCKGIFACWRDDKGRTRRKGVLIDIGITFKKKDGIQTGAHGNWDYVVPDISEFDDDIKDIVLTHAHADHMLGLIDLVVCGKAADKTVHASAYVCRVLTTSLKKTTVPRAQWPKMNILSGSGQIHIQADERRVLSVHYHVNAIPHSTEVTAFVVSPAPYACDGRGRATEKRPTPNPHYWSYASLGDMCFGPYNVPDYKGEKPLDTGLKRDFFAQFKEGVRREYPDSPASMQKRIDQISVVEIDPTSIHRDGFAPDIVAVEKTWNRLLTTWFSDKDAIVPNLSTAKRAHEMFMRLAVDSQRDMTTDGAYLEDRWVDMNQVGVNPDVLPTDSAGGNIGNYIDFYADLVGKPSIEYMRRTAKKMLAIMRDPGRRKIVLTTGSQGSEIEKDSVGTQVAEGWSRWQLDPKYFRSAYGTNPQNSIIVYAQGVIPGNEDTQWAQIRKTAYENDFTVAVPIHNGMRFFNLKEPHHSRIVADLERNGDTYTEDGNGGLFIHGCPLYPPGHGWKEDYRQGFFPWFRENNVQGIWVQHYSRYETVRIAHELADEAGLNHPSEPTPNHAVCTMLRGVAFKIVANLTPSFIFARNNRRADKYHGGTMEYLRAVFRSGGKGQVDDPLFAANDNNTAYFNAYGMSDFEQAKREQTLPPVRSRRWPDAAMTTMAPTLGMSTRAPVRVSAPMKPRHHPHLGLEQRVA